MKFNIQQNQLAPVLVQLARVTGKEPFDKVKIEATSTDYLRLTTTDGNLTMQAKVKCIDAQGEAITINCKDLSAIVSKLNGMIEFNDGIIKAGKSKLKKPVLDCSNFPAIKELEGEHLNINALSLVNAIKSSIHASGNGQGLLDGISVKVDEVATTDSNRMAVRKLDTAILDGQIILPKQLADEVAKSFGDEDITIVTDKCKVSFVSEDLTITSTLLEGTYPKHEQIIPKGYTKSFMVDKAEILYALDILSTVKNLRTNICIMDIKENELVISAHNNDDGEGTSSIDIDYNGEAIQVGFNIDFLVGAVRNTDSDVIKVEFDTGLRPFLITTNEKDVNLIMPVQIRTNAK